MKLFKYEGYKVIVEPEVLLLEPFKKIWKRDRSKSKDKATLEIAFIYFFCDPRSDYTYLVDDAERAKAIKEGEGLADNWKPDKVMLEAIKFYNSFKSTSILLLEDTRMAVDKLRTLLRTIDLTKTDKNDKPVYTLNNITATIKQVPALVKELNEAEKALSTDDAVKGKMRGQGEKTIFEDGFDM